MWHLPREIFDLAIESLNKYCQKIEKTRRVVAEKKAFKWEINIIILTKPMYLEISTFKWWMYLRNHNKEN